MYANRAQAYMAMREWSDGAVDAEASVEMKKQGNGKAWWRRGRCLMEMGRVEGAGEVVEVVLMALVEGSSWMGRKENESGVSIVRGVLFAVLGGRLWSTVVWRAYGEINL